MTFVAPLFTIFTFKKPSGKGVVLIIYDKINHISISGPLAQSAERGADNAKVVSSSLTRTNDIIFLTSSVSIFLLLLIFFIAFHCNKN